MEPFCTKIPKDITQQKPGEQLILSRPPKEKQVAQVSTQQRGNFDPTMDSSDHELRLGFHSLTIGQSKAEIDVTRRRKRGTLGPQKNKECRGPGLPLLKIIPKARGFSVRKRKDFGRRRSPLGVKPLRGVWEKPPAVPGSGQKPPPRRGLEVNASRSKQERLRFGIYKVQQTVRKQESREGRSRDTSKRQ